MKFAVLGLALMASAIIGAVAGYWLAGDRNPERPKAQASTTRKSTTPESRTVVLRDGQRLRDPRTNTTCLATGEAGVPNLFCTHGLETHSRFEVVIWSDRADLYDLARHGEPMVPTYSVPTK